MARPTGANRIRAFAKSFKGYMGVAALVTAALPIPVTQWKLIPMFESHSGMLKVYTSLLCFLIFAFVFYSRHWLGRLLFAKRLMAAAQNRDPGPGPAILAFLPLFLIAGTVASIIGYHYALDQSVAILFEHANQATTEKTLLATTERYAIPNASRLPTLYMLIFVFSELAFVIMGLKEHLQDVMGLTDDELLKGARPPARQRGP